MVKIESNRIYVPLVILFTTSLLCTILTITPPDSILKNVNGSSDEEDEQEEEEGQEEEEPEEKEEPEETSQFGGGFSRGPSGEGEGDPSGEGEGDPSGEGEGDPSGEGEGSRPSFDALDLCQPGQYYYVDQFGVRSCQGDLSGEGEGDPSGEGGSSDTLPLLNETTTTPPKKGSLGLLEGSTIDPKTGIAEQPTEVGAAPTDEATAPEQAEPKTLSEQEPEEESEE